MAITGIRSDNPSDLTAPHVKKNMNHMMLPHDQVWKVSICQELLEARKEEILIDGFTMEEARGNLEFCLLNIMKLHRDTSNLSPSILIVPYMIVSVYAK